MSPSRIAKHLWPVALLLALVLAACTSADTSNQAAIGDQDSVAPAVATAAPIPATPIPATPIPATPIPATPIPTATPAPTPTATPAQTTPAQTTPVPTQAAIPEDPCGELISFVDRPSDVGFRGSCWSGPPLWASATTDGSTMTVTSTTDGGESFTSFDFPYPDLVSEDESLPPNPGIVRLFADQDRYVAAVGHIAHSCCFIYVEMSFPSDLVDPAQGPNVSHPGTTTEPRGLRGAATAATGPEWAQGSYLYVFHEFVQVADQTWRIEIEPVAFTDWTDPEFGHPSGQYWAAPLSADPQPFPLEVASEMELRVDGDSVTALVRPGVLEIVDGDPTVEPETWHWDLDRWTADEG